MTTRTMIKSVGVAAIVALACGRVIAQDGVIGPAAPSERTSVVETSVGAVVSAAADRPLDVAPAIESRPIGGGVPIVRGNDRDTAPVASEAKSLPSMRVVGSLMLVIAVIAVLALVVRRGAKAGGGLLGALGPGGKAPCGVMFVLGRYPVSRQSTLVLLQVDRRVLLLCQSHGRGNGGAMTTLAEISDPAEVASILTKTREADGNSAARQFEEALAAADFNTARIVDDAAEPVASGLRGRLGSIRRLGAAAMSPHTTTTVGGRAA